MTVFLHDVGKLSRGWQAWVKGYQARIGNPVENGEAYAHTDFDGDDPEQDAAQKAQGKRPWHAVEGAIATVPFFYTRFGGNHPLGKAAFSAIARHHAPFSGENRDFQLIKSAPQYIYSVSDSLPDTSELPGLANPVSAYEGLKKYSVFLVSPQEYGAFHAYLLIARLLRLADSEGTRRGSLGS